MRQPVLFVVTALAWLAAGLCPVLAQEAPAGLKVGLVNLELVGAKFERKVEAETKLTEWYVVEQQYLRELGQYLFCSAKEWEEVSQIVRISKADRKPEQTERLSVLLQQNTDREREYKDLEAKLERTDEEEGRFQLLLDVVRTRDANWKQMVQELDNELGRRGDQIRNDLLKPVRDVVNQIAAERAFVVVLEKDWVYFGGEDVTDEVIKRLNAGTPPAAPEADKPEEAGAGEPPKEDEGDKPAEGGAD